MTPPIGFRWRFLVYFYLIKLVTLSNEVVLLLNTQNPYDFSYQYKDNMKHYT